MAAHEKHLSTTALARAIGKESKDVFVLLARGGWILKVDNHWQLTAKGTFEGGIYQNHPRYGDYIAWPESVQQHPIFLTLPEAPVTATTLGQKAGLPARLINLVLAERGWIRKHVRGWCITPAGTALGGQQHENEHSAVPYVTWPETLYEQRDYQTVVTALTDSGESASHLSLDGREFSSAAGAAISNWLYLAGVTYAANYALPGSANLRADFFIPEIRLCIDYWNTQGDASVLAAQLERQQRYREQQIAFLEIREPGLSHLDDVLGRELFRYGIAVY